MAVVDATINLLFVTQYCRRSSTVEVFYQHADGSLKIDGISVQCRVDGFSKVGLKIM